MKLEGKERKLPSRPTQPLLRSSSIDVDIVEDSLELIESPSEEEESPEIPLAEYFKLSQQRRCETEEVASGELSE
jgi:hypothetical protein